MDPRIRIAGTFGT